jgi:hypothetical protein
MRAGGVESRKVLNGAIRARRARQTTAVEQAAPIDRRLLAAAGLSLVGYLLLFVVLHLRSIGWAPGQVLDPWEAYWRFFYRWVISEERVMAARHSTLAARHTLVMIAALLGLAPGYLVTLRLLRVIPAEQTPRLRVLIGIALSCSLPLLLLPNLLSGDVYSYLSFGRIGAINGGNPFVDPPQTFSRDPYLSLVDWKQVPSVYGPGWIYPSMLLTLLVELVWPGVLGYVLAYKLLATGLHLLNGALIFRILGHIRPERRAWGTALYLLNPLVLLEFAGNAHNDVLMITFILLGIVAHLHGWPASAIAAFSLAVLTKWIALPLLPLYALLRIRAAGTPRRAVFAVVQTGGIFALLSAALYAPYWEGPETLRVLIDAPPQQRVLNSLGELVVTEVQYGLYALGHAPHPAFGKTTPITIRAPRSREAGSTRDWRVQQRIAVQRYNQDLQRLRARVTLMEQRLGAIVRWAGLLVVLLSCVAAVFFTRDLRTMLLATAWIFFVYTAIGAVWVWPWYATWFVALAALLDWRATGRTAILLSLLLPLLYPLSPRLLEPALLERYRAVLIFGPPIVFALYQLRPGARRRT